MDDKAADRGPGGPPGGPSQEGALVTIVQGLVRELRPKSPPPHITTSSRLEQDLGIDSLARTELSVRIERIFRIRLPLDRIGQAETVGDLIAAIEHATPGDARLFPAWRRRTPCRRCRRRETRER